MQGKSEGVWDACIPDLSDLVKSFRSFLIDIYLFIYLLGERGEG